MGTPTSLPWVPLRDLDLNLLKGGRRHLYKQKFLGRKFISRFAKYMSGIDTEGGGGGGGEGGKSPPPPLAEVPPP